MAQGAEQKLANLAYIRAGQKKGRAKKGRANKGRANKGRANKGPGQIMASKVKESPIEEYALHLMKTMQTISKPT